jgi:hypothetical protein
MKLNNAFAQLLTPAVEMAALGTKTKIKVQLNTGGRVWLDNVPNGSIQLELLKRKIGMSQVRFFERVEVAAR